MGEIITEEEIDTMVNMVDKDGDGQVWEKNGDILAIIVEEDIRDNGDGATVANLTLTHTALLHFYSSALSLSLSIYLLITTII